MTADERQALKDEYAQVMEKLRAIDSQWMKDRKKPRQQNVRDRTGSLGR